MSWYPQSYATDYNTTKKRKVFIVFDDIIAKMAANEKVIPIVTELFLRERKLDISLAFYMSVLFQST